MNDIEQRITAVQTAVCTKNIMVNSEHKNKLLGWSNECGQSVRLFRSKKDKEELQGTHIRFVSFRFDSLWMLLRFILIQFNAIPFDSIQWNERTFGINSQLHTVGINKTRCRYDRNRYCWTADFLCYVTDNKTRSQEKVAIKLESNQLRGCLSLSRSLAMHVFVCRC